MRINTGIAKGINLVTLEGLETRPTAERTKEAVFSMLQFDIEGRRVLDLFSGSGQMALEALSRGAESAVMIDKSANAVKIIKTNAEKTRLLEKSRIYCTDCFDYLNRNKGEKFDIVFIDPPYALKLVGKSLKALAENDSFRQGALVVCESAESDVIGGDVYLEQKFECVKSKKYGVAYVNIFTLKGDVTQ